MSAKEGSFRKGRAIRDALSDVFRSMDKLEEGETLRELLRGYVQDALNGCKETRKDLLDRMYGRPVQATELTGSNGEPLQVVWPLPKSLLDQ